MTVPLSPELPIDGSRKPLCLSLLKGKLKNGEYSIGTSLYFNKILYECPLSISLYKIVLDETNSQSGLSMLQVV